MTSVIILLKNTTQLWKLAQLQILLLRIYQHAAEEHIEQLADLYGNTKTKRCFIKIEKAENTALTLY